MELLVVLLGCLLLAVVIAIVGAPLRAARVGNWPAST